MNPSPILVNVPRQEFTGWVVSLAAYKVAGIGDMEFVFDQEELRIASPWGQTRMPCDGRFKGTLMLGRGVLKLAPRMEKRRAQPSPIPLLVDPAGKTLTVDGTKFRARISPNQFVGDCDVLEIPPASVRVKVETSLLSKMIRKAYSKLPGKLETLQITAAREQIIFQSSKRTVTGKAHVWGSGEWSVKALLFWQLLDTYKASAELELEADAGGMRIQSVRMPIGHWRQIDDAP